MTEYTIQSDEPKARQSIDKMLAQVRAKCDGTDGWSAVYVKRDDGSTQLLVAFPPTNPAPETVPEGAE